MINKALFLLFSCWNFWVHAEQVPSWPSCSDVTNTWNIFNVRDGGSKIFDCPRCTSSFQIIGSCSKSCCQDQLEGKTLRGIVATRYEAIRYYVNKYPGQTGLQPLPFVYYNKEIGDFGFTEWDPTDIDKFKFKVTYFEQHAILRYIGSVQEGAEKPYLPCWPTTMEPSPFVPGWFDYQFFFKSTFAHSTTPDCSCGYYQAIDIQTDDNCDPYRYECYDSYRGDLKCVDIDECAEGTDNCGLTPHSHCVNTPGSFRCDCDSGYFSRDNKCVSYGTPLDAVVKPTSTSAKISRPLPVLPVPSWKYIYNIVDMSNPSYPMPVYRATEVIVSQQLVESGIHISNLNPGTNYSLIWGVVDETNTVITETYHYTSIENHFTTLCTCGSASDAPILGSDTVTQEHGHVYFKFLGNSMCGNAYTFSRQSYDSDFNLSEHTVFTPNYFFTGGECSPVPYEPGKASSDVLANSKLAVGTRYRYNFRATGNKYLGEPSYMDFVVRWESSISGFVGLQPTFGDLPVEDVIVQWALKDLNGTIVLDGKTKTSKSGRFTIHPNALIPFDNDLDYPLHLSFSKVTELDNAHSINHEFLCNNGRVNCTDTEHVVYLKHLDFDVPVSVIDATSVPISGKVYVADTSVNPDDTRWGSDGCPVEKAKVCLIDRSPSGTQSEIICTETANDGTYTVPGVIGSRVSINVTFHNHTFEYLPPKGFPDFSTGIEIKPHHIYEHNDFMDTTTVPLEITIAGGECDLPLGAAKVLYTINGCLWGGRILHQPQWRNTHNSIPTQDLKFFVQEIEKRPDIKDLVKDLDLTKAASSNEATEPTIDVVEGQTTKAKNITKLRFQFDGDSKIRIEFQSDMNDGCSKMTPDAGEANSLHVLPFQRPTVATIFIERDLGAGLVCDAVDPSSQIQIRNNLGLLDNSEDDAYAVAIASSMPHEALQLLYHCYKGCVANVTHDYDVIAKRNRRARVEFQFMTGRPNTAKPFTKQLIVQTLERKSVSYTAAVVITGQYKKGDLYSVGLPTYNPVLIIRDPPGGSSYAYYENVQTTLRLESRKHSEYTGADSKVKFLTGVKADVKTCLGLGLSLCKDVQKVKVVTGYHHNSVDFDLARLSNTVYSGGFTTTWSYKTPSSNALMAGNLSDTYLVPNLNMKFSIIDTVSWNATTCTASSIEETAFNLESPENVPALAFVTGFEIVNTEIPALELNIASNMKKLNETTDDTERAQLENEIKVLKDALQGWRDAIELNAKLKRDAIEGDAAYQVKPHQWFDKVGSLAFVNDTKAIDVRGMTHNSALLSENLKSRATVRPAYENAQKSITDLESINTIKFAGGGSEFTFRLSQSKMQQHVSDLGGSRKSNSENEWDFVTDETYVLFNLDVAFSYGSRKESTDENLRTDETSGSTSIGFVLSDPDAGDQFDVDIFVDPMYRTFVFNTRSGKSSCKHEVGTESRQSARLELVSAPPEIVLENEAMVFHYRITKTGMGSLGYTLSQDVREDSDALHFFPSIPREFSIIEEGQSILGTVTISRGPEKYEYPSVKLMLQPTCEYRMHSLLGKEATIAQIELYNYIDPVTNEKKIVFARPCAPVTLQGDIARDQHFVVRANDPDAAVKVVVQNPRSNIMTWANAIQDSRTRLKRVQLLYRPVGTIQWSSGRYSVNGTMKDIDFSLAGIEDAYGFATLGWEVKGLADGNYEMQVRTVCDDVRDAPAIFNGQQTQVIRGVLDRKSPKLYGLPQPQVRLPIGQPMTFTFDKQLDCSLPYKFVVDLLVEGVERKFDNDNLLLICEDRQIMVQFDAENTDMNSMIDKSLSLKLSQVIDVNRNMLASEISYSVKVIAAGNDQPTCQRQLHASPQNRLRSLAASSELEELQQALLALKQDADALRQEMSEAIERSRQEAHRDLANFTSNILDALRSMQNR